ncbi:hypothetical protein BGX28_007370 [Mortierella sp. GBA30]|nr:hypothetical protein BGX28_007370 [Mortierella sp. GBA30]
MIVATMQAAPTMPDVPSILASDTALLDPSMTKEQVLAIGHHLTQNGASLARLVLIESFRDLQDAVKEFLALPCCSELRYLEYKAGGSSFAKLLLCTVSSSAQETVLMSLDQLNDDTVVYSRVPFAKTITTLRLGYNSDAPQGETDIHVFNGLLKHMSCLQEFSMAQSLDDLSLFKGLDQSLPALKKISIAVNKECGMDQQDVETKIHEAGYLPRIEHLEVEMDERESGYYLNQSRDRQFQAFVRRFGGERK